MAWKRKEFTTRGADPTVVVEWSFNKEITIIEFQGVYQCDKLSADVAESVHQLLEADWENNQRGSEDDRNYDRLYYGGM